MERVEVEAKDIVRRECDGISWSYQGKHKGSITRAMRIGGKAASSFIRSDTVGPSLGIVLGKR
jgi:hypothetical protein